MHLKKYTICCYLSLHCTSNLRCEEPSSFYLFILYPLSGKQGSAGAALVWRPWCPHVHISHGHCMVTFSHSIATSDWLLTSVEANNTTAAVATTAMIVSFIFWSEKHFFISSNSSEERGNHCHGNRMQQASIFIVLEHFRTPPHLVGAPVYLTLPTSLDTVCTCVCVYLCVCVRLTWPESGNLPCQAPTK